MKKKSTILILVVVLIVVAGFGFSYFRSTNSQKAFIELPNRLIASEQKDLGCFRYEAGLTHQTKCMNKVEFEYYAASSKPLTDLDHINRQLSNHGWQEIDSAKPLPSVFDTYKLKRSKDGHKSLRVFVLDKQTSLPEDRREINHTNTLINFDYEEILRDYGNQTDRYLLGLVYF